MSKLNKKTSDNLIKFGVVALALGIVFFVSSKSQAAGIPTPDDSMGAWSNLSVASANILPGYELQLEEQYRYHGTDNTEQHTDISIGKTLRSWTGTVGYKNVYGTEHRPYASVGIALPRLLGFDTSVGTQFEWRDLETFRQRIGAYAQTEIAGFAPYISNEVYINIDAGSNFIDKNRISVGVAKPITDIYSVEAYYNLDSNFIGDVTNNISAIGLGLNIAL